MNKGHGHVFPRADGVKARCGGPSICHVCAIDLGRKRAQESVAAAEPVPSKDVSLDDLKWAIDNYVTHPLPGWEANAWRTAFQWRDGWHERGDAILPGPGNGYAEWKQEGIDGMALIREKLR